jgi:hypothetical protein
MTKLTDVEHIKHTTQYFLGPIYRVIRRRI